MVWHSAYVIRQRLLTCHPYLTVRVACPPLPDTYTDAGSTWGATAIIVVKSGEF